MEKEATVINMYINYNFLGAQETHERERGFLCLMENSRRKKLKQFEREISQ